MRTKQINNMTIRYSSLRNKWKVIKPDKIVLDEFNTLEEAENYAKSIKDFRKVKKIKYNINDIEELCSRVNEKYNLKPNEIGSVEHHSSMCENSIVQIGNEARGIIQLASGTDKILASYLIGVLDDIIELKIRKKEEIL